MLDNPDDNGIIAGEGTLRLEFDTELRDTRDWPAIAHYRLQGKAESRVQIRHLDVSRI